MGLSLTWSLLIWLIVVLVAYVIARKRYIEMWDAAVLAILFGYLFMLLFVPFGAVYARDNLSNPWIFVYITISVLSPLLLAVYIFQNALKHRSKNNTLFHYKQKAS
jgi:hypothetical protein